MTNRHRGDVSLVLDGQVHALRLTLQSLAEIEDALGGTLATLSERFGSGSILASDLIMLLGAAMRGGGSTLSNREIASRVAADAMPDVIHALGALFTLTFGGPASNPQEPQGA
jgi:hypothetical protein